MYAIESVILIIDNKDEETNNDATLSMTTAVILVKP